MPCQYGALGSLIALYGAEAAAAELHPLATIMDLLAETLMAAVAVGPFIILLELHYR